MNLCSPSRIAALLQELDLTPRRTWGQHFLADRNILDLILHAAGLKSGQRVLEVGPGLGVVTEALLERGCRVWAVEKDPRLCRHLHSLLGGCPGLELREGDALDVDWEQACATPFDRWVSNLPYGAGSRLLVELSAVEQPPERAVLMVQRDVAERLLAAPGSRAYGLLTLAAGLAFETALVHHVSPACFIPKPGVWSTVVRLCRRADRPAPDVFRRIMNLARQAFRGRRKQMATLMRRMRLDPALLAEVGLDPQARPETLLPEQWSGLVARLPSDGGQEQ